MADGDGLVSHAGSALLARVADKAGLTRALSGELGPLQLRAGSHDRGVVVRDLAVMLADGGDCLSDLGAVRDQAVLFGRTASDATAFRVIDQIASDPQGIEWLRAAHARARARFWDLAGAPKELRGGRLAGPLPLLQGGSAVDRELRAQDAPPLVGDGGEAGPTRVAR
jgi:hypothetical protein